MKRTHTAELSRQRNATTLPLVVAKVLRANLNHGLYIHLRRRRTERRRHQAGDVLLDTPCCSLQGVRSNMRLIGGTGKTKQRVLTGGAGWCGCGEAEVEASSSPMVVEA
jgi:hypothetical protein